MRPARFLPIALTSSAIGIIAGASRRDEQGKRIEEADYMIALANLVCGSKPKLDAGTDGEAGTP